MNSDSENSNPINETIGLDKQTPAYKRAKVWVVAAIVAVLIAGGVIFVYPKNDVSPQYNTAHVQQGNLIVTVTATGKLEPVNQGGCGH